VRESCEWVGASEVSRKRNNGFANCRVVSGKSGSNEEMIAKNLELITLNDIQDLVTNNVLERRTLEYKSALPDITDSSKKEFLADVSSFANTIGGDLIFGITEQGTGLSNDLGVPVTDIDGEISRLNSIIRDGISPRIQPDVISISATVDKRVVIIRVRGSLEGPHRVVYKGHDRFYGRNSNGKYPMDVLELRAAFAQSSTLIERIRSFRINRIGDIKTGYSPVTLAAPARFLSLHLIPLSAFTSRYTINSQSLLKLKEGEYTASFKPLYTGGWNHRINLDGVLAYTKEGNGISTYSQMFRNGIVETVDTILVSERTNDKVLPMYLIEQKVMDQVKNYMVLLAELAFQPPVYAFLSLCGVKEYRVARPERNIFLEPEPIVVNEILLPEVVLESFEANIAHAFRPVFDMIWNASGISKSFNFSDDDEFQ